MYSPHPLFSILITKFRCHFSFKIYLLHSCPAWCTFTLALRRLWWRICSIWSKRFCNRLLTTSRAKNWPDDNKTLSWSHTGLLVVQLDSWELLDLGYYNGCALNRGVKALLTQFGILADFNLRTLFQSPHLILKASHLGWYSYWTSSIPTWLHQLCRKWTEFAYGISVYCHVRYQSMAAS
jgi:hypothetical protein